MKTFLRTLILLAIVVWLGGLLFFPIVAAISFGTLAGNTHDAGAIVGACLRVLHKEGLVCGVVLVMLLLAGKVRGLYTRSIYPAILAVVVMLALTSYSQYNIIPRMENYRVAAGGVISAVPMEDPNRAAFDRLHQESTRVEEGVMLAGLVFVVLLARSESENK